MMPVAWDMRFDTSNIDHFLEKGGPGDPLRNTTLLALQYHDLRWGRHLIRMLSDLLQKYDGESEYLLDRRLPRIEQLLDLILELPKRRSYPKENADIFHDSLKALADVR
jgi:hypothetical protein